MFSLIRRFTGLDIPADLFTQGSTCRGHIIDKLVGVLPEIHVIDLFHLKLDLMLSYEQIFKLVESLTPARILPAAFYRR
jgi:hypothetical protein